MEIIIDEEFAGLLPALASVEHEELERSLIEHGRALDPLKVWKETGILIDGHNRLPICERHSLPYDTVYLSFNDRQAAIEWITRYQLSRRNLTPGQRNEFFEKVYKAHKKEHGGDHGQRKASKQKNPSPQNEDLDLDAKTSGNSHVHKKTAEKVAEAAGVSKATVERAVKQSEIVNKLGETTPKLSKAIKDSSKKIPAKIIEELAGDQELAGRVEEKVKAGVEVVEAVKEVKAEVEPGDEENEPATDKMPDHIRAIFNLRPAIRRVIAIVRDAKKSLHELSEKHPEVCVFMHLDHAERQLHEVKSHINLCQPFNLCPYCRGKTKQETCQGCKGNGWVPKTIFTNAPRELREVIK